MYSVKVTVLIEQIHQNIFTKKKQKCVLLAGLRCLNKNWWKMNFNIRLWRVKR